MASFIHLCPETSQKKIRRSGIKPSRVRGGEVKSGVYSMAVTEDFFISHQWLRELKAEGARTIVGVYFRIPDEETVAVGHYGKKPVLVSAAEAVGIIRSVENAEGYEVLIPRRIQPSEISKIRHVPQVVGWRHYPGAHGDKPCGCPACQTDRRPGSRKIRDAFEQGL